MMEFWIFVAALFFLYFSIPYIRLLVKRIILVRKLKKACRESRYILKPAHPLWFFGRNNSGHCDFYCISREKSRMYSVKLWASLYRLSDLTFFDDRKYRIKRYIPLCGRGRTFEDGLVWQKESRIKKRKDIDWYYGAKDDGSCRCIPVLLVNPAPLKVYRSRIVPLTNHERGYVFAKAPDTTVQNTIAYDGEYLYDAYLFAAASFVRELDHSAIF